MSGGKENVTIWQVGIRCILYAMLLAGVGLLPALDIAANPFGKEIQFAEFSFVQLTQSATLILGLLVCGYLLYDNVLPQLFLIIIMGFARMFGGGRMWQQIMGDRYTKTIKYFAGESV